MVTRWRAEGEGKRSGARVEMAGLCVFTMHGGKVCRVEFFETRRQALAELAVCPPSHNAPNAEA